MLIGWKSAKVFPRCYFEPSPKTRMRSVEAVGSGAGQTFSADCQSSLSFPWWLPVITTLHVHVEATLVLTASHHYGSRDDFQSSLLFPCSDFQSSQLGPRWSNACADRQSVALLFPCWLPDTNVPMITSIITTSEIRVHGNPICSHDDFQSSLYRFHDD